MEIQRIYPSKVSAREEANEDVGMESAPGGRGSSAAADARRAPAGEERGAPGRLRARLRATSAGLQELSMLREAQRARVERTVHCRQGRGERQVSSNPSLSLI